MNDGLLWRVWFAPCELWGWNRIVFGEVFVSPPDTPRCHGYRGGQWDIFIFKNFFSFVWVWHRKQTSSLWQVLYIHSLFISRSTNADDGSGTWKKPKEPNMRSGFKNSLRKNMKKEMICVWWDMRIRRSRGHYNEICYILKKKKRKKERKKQQKILAAGFLLNARRDYRYKCPTVWTNTSHLLNNIFHACVFLMQLLQLMFMWRTDTWHCLSY